MINPVQSVLPLAFLHGEAFTQRPQDLYIPPDALEVALEAFEGPLDLLLYLIKRHKLDILELSIHSITCQYVQYVELMKEFKLELAAEYLVMAALLAQIKSRLLLPVHEELAGEEEDPRAELVRRLQEYEQFKKAAEGLDDIPRLDRDVFVVELPTPIKDKPDALLPDVNIKELLVALTDVMARAQIFTHHQISAEVLSTRERMSQILSVLSQQDDFVEFALLFDLQEGRSGVVVTFIALLELIKEGLIECVQPTFDAQLYLRLKGAEPQ